MNGSMMVKIWEQDEERGKENIRDGDDVDDDVNRLIKMKVM